MGVGHAIWGGLVEEGAASLENLDRRTSKIIEMYGFKKTIYKP
jgi:hypothetical protein